MTTNPVTFGWLDQFLATYASYPAAANGDNYSFGFSDFFTSVFGRLDDMIAAVNAIHAEGNLFSVQLYTEENDIQNTAVADLDNLVPAELDGIFRQTIQNNGSLAVDAAHMRAVIDNQYAFVLATEIVMTDTAANIAAIQDHIQAMSEAGWSLGPATLTTKIADMAAAMQVLSVGSLRELVDGGINHIDVIDDRIEMSLAQYNALADVTFATEDQHVVRGTKRDDVCSAGEQWTAIFGRRGNDRLELGTGGGELAGGRGRDVLVGADGTDVFTFAKSASSAALASQADVIRNFGDGDRIRLSFLDGQDGRATFVWIGEAAFSSSAGEVRFEIVDGRIDLQADEDGDGVADFSLWIRGTIELMPEDFIV